MPDLANVRSIGIEFEQLRGRRTIGWSRCVATGEDKDVTSGIDRYARRFSEIDVGWQLKEISLREEPDFRNSLLSDQRVRQEKCRRKSKASHCSPWQQSHPGDLPLVNLQPLYSCMRILALVAAW